MASELVLRIAPLIRTMTTPRLPSKMAPCSVELDIRKGDRGVAWAFLTYAARTPASINSLAASVCL